MYSTVFFLVAVGLVLAALTFSLHKAAESMVIDPPIKVMVNEYRVVFAQRGWSFVTASIEQKHCFGFKHLSFWRTIHIQERRFGDQSWGYSMRELSELPPYELEQLAVKFVSEYPSKKPAAAMQSVVWEHHV